MSDLRDDKLDVRTYLTPEEAKEFHKLFITSFIIFTVVAIIAHVLAWNWRQWLPSADGYAALDTGMAYAQATITSLLA